MSTSNPPLLEHLPSSPNSGHNHCLSLSQPSIDFEEAVGESSLLELTDKDDSLDSSASSALPGSSSESSIEIISCNHTVVSALRCTPDIKMFRHTATKEQPPKPDPSPVLDCPGDAATISKSNPCSPTKLSRTSPTSIEIFQSVVSSSPPKRSSLPNPVIQERLFSSATSDSRIPTGSAGSSPSSIGVRLSPDFTCPPPVIPSDQPLVSLDQQNQLETALSQTPPSRSPVRSPPTNAVPSPGKNGSEQDDFTAMTPEIDDRIPNVYINGLPPHYPDEQLYKMTCEFGPVVSVRTFTRHVGDKMSGYGFVLFGTMDAADKCIESLRRYRNLHPSLTKQNHKIPGTTYATQNSLPPISLTGSKSDSDSFSARLERLSDKNSTNLYMEGLPLSISETTLSALVSPHVIKSSRFFQTKLSNPPRIIAFVRFETRQAAEEIIERLHGRVVRGWNDNGCRIAVRFADTSEQRELRRIERAARGDDDGFLENKLSMAEAALLNLRGAQLQMPLSPSLSALNVRNSRADIVIPSSHSLPAIGSNRLQRPMVSPGMATSASFGDMGDGRSMHSLSNVSMHAPQSVNMAGYGGQSDLGNHGLGVKVDGHVGRRNHLGHTGPEQFVGNLQGQKVHAQDYILQQQQQHQQQSMQLAQKYKEVQEYSQMLEKAVRGMGLSVGSGSGGYNAMADGVLGSYGPALVRRDLGGMAENERLLQQQQARMQMLQQKLHQHVADMDPSIVGVGRHHHQRSQLVEEQSPMLMPSANIGTSSALPRGDLRARRPGFDITSIVQGTVDSGGKRAADANDRERLLGQLHQASGKYGQRRDPGGNGGGVSHQLYHHRQHHQPQLQEIEEGEEVPLCRHDSPCHCSGSPAMSYNCSASPALTYNSNSRTPSTLSPATPFFNETAFGGMGEEGGKMGGDKGKGVEAEVKRPGGRETPHEARSGFPTSISFPADYIVIHSFPFFSPKNLFFDANELNTSSNKNINKQPAWLFHPLSLLFFSFPVILCLKFCARPVCPRYSFISYSSRWSWLLFGIHCIARRLNSNCYVLSMSQPGPQTAVRGLRDEAVEMEIEQQEKCRGCDAV